jgi:hypothetical protein
MRITRRLALRQWLGAAVGSAVAYPMRAAGPPVTVKVGGAAIEVTFESDRFNLPQEALVNWVTQAARAVSSYYGHFPVERARIRIYAEGRRGVSNGTSYGDDGVWCRISVGRETTVADLDDDWMMTHEMVHFGFPSVPRRHHWIEEGIATYVEPIARVQIGNLTAARVWGDLMHDMHQGLPEEGDEGLDKTHTWGRTYWGGALFCLMADIGIRKNTANAKGFEDALRAINRAGGTITVDWPLERALEIGDKAGDGKTLRDLYKQMATKPVNVDLPDLWKQLGVQWQNGEVVFDAKAPLAAVRDRIMRAPARS